MSTIEQEVCGICEKPIDEEKQNYETTEIYVDGNYEDSYIVHTDCRYTEDQNKKRVAVWCDTCQMILDEGIIDADSSLLLWNDFTKIKRHLEHTIMLRLRVNCPKSNDNILGVQSR